MTLEIDSETAEVAELLRLAGSRPEDAVMEQARDFLAKGVYTPVAVVTAKEVRH